MQTEIAQPLTPDRRDRVLTEVYRELNGCLAPDVEARPVEGAEMLDTHLDALVDIVRRSTAETIEPYLAQILDDVCSRCPRQTVSGYCPQRASGPCVVYRFASPIIRAIQRALHEMGDDEYESRRH